MGEHADDALWDLLFGRGSEDPEEDYRRGVTCVDCKEKGLHWVQTPDGWRLFNSDDEKHVCTFGVTINLKGFPV